MEKVSTIYLVRATTGEYSDRSEWTVCAYTQKEDAEKHVALASQFSKEWESRSRGMDWVEENEALKTANPMDPNFSCDYTGTDYFLEECELRNVFTHLEKPSA